MMRTILVFRLQSCSRFFLPWWQLHCIWYRCVKCSFARFCACSSCEVKNKFIKKSILFLTIIHIQYAPSTFTGTSFSLLCVSLPWFEVIAAFPDFSSAAFRAAMLLWIFLRALRWTGVSGRFVTGWQTSLFWLSCDEAEDGVGFVVISAQFAFGCTGWLGKHVKLMVTGGGGEMRTTLSSTTASGVDSRCCWLLGTTLPSLRGRRLYFVSLIFFRLFDLFDASAE